MRLPLLVPTALPRGPASAGCVAAALVLAVAAAVRAAPTPPSEPSSAADRAARGDGAEAPSPSAAPSDDAAPSTPALGADTEAAEAPPEPDRDAQPAAESAGGLDDDAPSAVAGANESLDGSGSTQQEPEGSDADAQAPRPELPPPMDLPTEPPWRRHLELGAAVAYVSRPLFHERAANAPSYRPGVGFAVLLHWDLLSFLRFSPYFYNVSHGLVLPPGSLSSEATNTVSRGATFSEASVSTFAFGAKLDPTLWLDERLKLWISAGVGWGRLYVPELTVTDPQHGEFLVGERSSVFVEFPLGLGAGVDLIERWLSLEYQVTATPLSGQSGSALDNVQAVDSSGQLLDVGPVEELDVTFVHTLGLTLIL